MKKWLGLLFLLFPIVALSLYVAGFFVFTDLRSISEHPGDEFRYRRFPSPLLMSLWRPMRLYDRHVNRCTHWIDRTPTPY